MPSASYLSSLDNPANKQFLKAAKAKFGDKMRTPNELSVPPYEAIYAYAAAVKKAGATDGDKVVKALSSVSVEGPRGTIVMNKQHHAPLTMYLGRVKGDGSVEVINSFPNVDPGKQCPRLAG